MRAKCLPRPLTVIRLWALLPILVGLLAAAANWGVYRVLKGTGSSSPAIRLACLHNLGDVYVSLAPVAAGVLVMLTGASVFDPAIALLVALWLAWSTVKEIVSSGQDLLWPEDAVCEHGPLEAVASAR